MKWVIDLDGVINANPDFFKWWTFHLKKKGNNNEIHILTARNPSRVEETKSELDFWGIKYDYLHTMTDLFDRKLFTLGEWKRNKILELKPDVWIENELKTYKAIGVDFNNISDKVNIINL